MELERAGRVNLRRLRPTTLAPFALLICSPALHAQNCAPGEVRVIVLDSQESPVFNAQVSLSSDPGSPRSRSTQTSGLADFPDLPCGAWNISIDAEGFAVTSRKVEIASGAVFEVRLVVTPRIHTEKIEVKETAAAVEQSSSQNYELRPAEVKRLPTNPATVNDTLPLVPGVVRDQKGEIRIDGSGQERSAMVVNQADITDPATGKFGQTVPVDSIETVNVFRRLFSPNTAASRRASSQWKPTGAAKNGMRISTIPFPISASAVITCAASAMKRPRFVVGGPLIKDRLYLHLRSAVFSRRDRRPYAPFPFNESRQRARQFLHATGLSSRQRNSSPRRSTSARNTPTSSIPITSIPSRSLPATRSTITSARSPIISAFWAALWIAASLVPALRRAIGAQGPGDNDRHPAGNRGNYFGPRIAMLAAGMAGNLVPCPFTFLGHAPVQGRHVAHRFERSRASSPIVR